MPLAKIDVVESCSHEARIAKVSGSIQAVFVQPPRVPPDDFYQLIFELPKNRFLHTPSFVGMHYTDDLIMLDLTFVQGRPKETRLALLKDINTRVPEAAAVSPDDMMITMYEVPGENISFGRGEAQRVNADRPRVRGRTSNFTHYLRRHRHCDRGGDRTGADDATKVPAGDQSQDCKGPAPRYTGQVARPCRRGDRMRACVAAIAHSR